MSARSILILFCTIATLSLSVPAQDSKSFPVGPGGRLFLKPDVDQILGRPYVEHVPMACTGECLWAAHPDGWAFQNGVNYYLISTGGIGFDIQIDNGTKGLTPYSAQFLPSRIEMKGGEGDFDIVGAKWISPDDVLCVSLKLSNSSATEKRVWLRMVLPSSSVKSEGERSSWTVKQPYGDLTLLAQADGFVAEEQVPEGKTAYLTEGETPASQHGSEGFDSKAAASGGAVLGSGFGGVEGHRAEWKIEVGEPIEDAVLSIRYARALKGDAEWKLSMPGIGKVERVGFPSTGGWGDTPEQFKLLTVKLGKIEKVTQTVQLVAVSNLDNTNIDALCIHPLGSEFPAATTGTTRLIREVALAPNSSQQIGLYVAAATQRASRPNSSALPAKIETNSGVAQVRRYSASSSSSASTPGFDSPTALISPPGHGRTHGAGCPGRAARLHDLVVTAPAPACATRRSEATVVPSTPDASTSGDSSARPANWTASGFMP